MKKLLIFHCCFLITPYFTLTTDALGATEELQKKAELPIEFPSSLTQEKDPVLIINNENTSNKLPDNFRIVYNGWSLRSLFSFSSRVGLDKLKASGSAQFSENGLREVLKRIPSKNLIVVDLRQESHGFVNGIAVSWYGPRNAANLGKTRSEITRDEEKRLRELAIQKRIAINKIQVKIQDIIEKVFPIPIIVIDAYTEQKLVEDSGNRYVRIPVTDHHAPTKENVNQFLAFVGSLSPDTWVHFHCAAGKGRTTTFLSMYDMIHNAKELSFKAIIERQHLLGGKNLAVMSDKNKWKYPYSVQRLKFLKTFYKKCRQKATNL